MIGIQQALDSTTSRPCVGLYAVPGYQMGVFYPRARGQIKNDAERGWQNLVSNQHPRIDCDSSHGTHPEPVRRFTVSDDVDVFPNWLNPAGRTHGRSMRPLPIKVSVATPGSSESSTAPARLSKSGMSERPRSRLSRIMPFFPCGFGISLKPDWILENFTKVQWALVVGTRIWPAGDLPAFKMIEHSHGSVRNADVFRVSICRIWRTRQSG